MHIKRKTIPAFWPISRTGTKYMAVPIHNKNDSLPLIIVMRDILDLVKTKKEMKKIVHEKKILVNGKLINSINYPLSLFDTLAIPSVKKFYRAELNGKKINFSEIKESEVNIKMFKVIGKTTLPGKKVQINFNGGKNLLSNEKINVGDFALIDMTNNKIKNHVVLGKNTSVLVVEGKHKGKSGKIKEIFKEGENIIAKIESKLEEISTNIDKIYAIE